MAELGSAQAWQERFPIGEAFRFLDAARLEAAAAVGSYLITGREAALAAHFKSGPVMPASLMLEALGQLGVFYLLESPEAATAAGGVVAPGSIYFASCDGVRCARICRPGDRLELRVTARRLKAPLAVFSGEIVVEGRRAARVEELTLSFGNAPAG